MSESLSVCGCCEGTEHETPMPVVNRPGLSALAYRVGTYGRFKASMHAALGEQPGLVDLTTRDDADPTLALIDAWAVVLDVLTFYQERIANEGYLRTATERLSVLQLARQIGYELAPGVAASTALAFVMQTGPGTPESARIPIGTQAQTVPGQDELPQTFETVEEITARQDWQSLLAQQRTPVEFRRGLTEMWLKGVDLNLRQGDGLLLVGREREGDPDSERWDFRRIREVHLDRDRVLTRVVFERGLGSFVPPMLPASDPSVYVFRQRAALFGANAPDWRAMPDSIKREYSGDRSIPNQPWGGTLTIRDISGRGEEEFQDGPVHLDALYPEIVPGSWVVLSHRDYAEAYRVESVAEDARTGYTLSSKSTRVELRGENLEAQFDHRVRHTVVYAVSEELTRSDAPLTTPVQGAVVTLNDEVDGLAEGQLIAIAGTDLDTGESADEIAEIQAIQVVDGRTELTFVRPLAHRYAREDAEAGEVVGARFNANVARATHGKTIAHEVLGSGDGSVPFQRFTLTHAPLTYTAAPTPSGAATTLEVRVGGVRWQEVPSLYGQPADARVYTTRLSDDGTVTVQFGDGLSGARLPTGVENVTARYRHGIGLGGLVEDGQIRLLMTRPLGVKDVGNPDAPTGADDPERLEDARRNAPLTVLTLDRVVSVQDVEDYARAFAGIGKAQATVLWSGESQIVHLTVAGPEGATVVEGSDLFTSLLASLDAARHVHARIVASPHEARTFGLSAMVTVDDAFLDEAVLQAVETALADAFSFETRGFGQSVSTAEVLAVMQAVEGVVFVDINRLGGADPFRSPRLDSLPARWVGGEIRPAQLLTLDPGSVTLTPSAP